MADTRNDNLISLGTLLEGWSHIVSTLEWVEATSEFVLPKPPSTSGSALSGRQLLLLALNQQ